MRTTIEVADFKARWVPLSRILELESSRPSDAQIQELAGALEDSRRGTAREPVPPDTLRAALALAREGARRHIEARNERYTLEELERLAPFLATDERRGLTEEQARAIICFDERILLVASAGSGKTFTMVEKALYALRRGLIAAPNILLVAFNKKAAEELRTRLREALDKTGREDISIRAETFHALGLSVDGEVRAAVGKGKRSVASWAEDDKSAARKFDELLSVKLRTDLVFAMNWCLLQSLYWFDSRADQVRGEDRKYDTTRGESVKSLPELAIANWLHLHGIEYEYERPYDHFTATASRSQYKPDFYYPDIDTWHEHFAIYSDGRPPPFEGYLEDAQWKRDTHAEYGTRFFETTAEEYEINTLLDKLEDELRKRGLNLSLTHKYLGSRRSFPSIVPSHAIG